MGLKPDALTYYNQLAQVYNAQNQPREAIATYKTVLELEPTRREARERLVELYKTRRRQAEVAGTAFDEKTLRGTGERQAQQMDARDLNEMLALAMSYQER